MQATMYNHSFFWETGKSPSELKEMFDKILIDCGFTTISYVEHHFDPQGWTALWLLGESHLAIHTFPEEGKIYVELSSCVLTPFKNFVDWYAYSKEKVYE